MVKALVPKDSLTETISLFSSETAKAWNGAKPIMKCFQAKKFNYLYDTGTNRIYSCSPFEYSFLNNLLSLPIQDALDMSRYSCCVDEIIDGLKNIIRLMKEKNVMKATRINIQVPDQWDESVHTTLGQIILETTERCNLRCRYCIYSPSFDQKRNHGTSDMPLDIAYLAIDHLSSNSSLKKKVAISFYGGEPLLCFPFILDCVRYAKTKIPREKLYFSLTTNGTLLTREMADYFFANGFGVHVSIDGPQDVHDENRIHSNGRGSFVETIRGMKYLLDAFGKEYNRLSVSMVYSPPYSGEKISKIVAFWNDNPWIPKDISLSFSYQQRSISPSQMNYDGIDYSVLNWAIKDYFESFQDGRKPHPIAAQVLEKKLAIIHKRYTFLEQIENSSLNACCMPAARKIYFAVDGTMSLCERVGSAPDFGNVRSGMNIERIKRLFLFDYRDRSDFACSSCWCSRLCDICYVQSYYNGSFDGRYKNYYCEIQKVINETFLRLYCRLLEIDPRGLDYLLEMKIT